MSEPTILGAVFDVTTEGFERDVLQHDEPILLDFWAPWCGPCQAMKPILNDAAKSLKGVCRVAKVNIDEERAIAEAFGIQSIPTCVLMKGNQALTGFVGVMPASEIVKVVTEKLAEASPTVK